MTSLSDFSLFLEFPFDIRLIIWKMCLPRRVINAESPIFHDCKYWDRVNVQMPIIAHVCRESRSVVFWQGHCFREAKAQTQMEALQGWGQRPQVRQPPREIDKIDISVLKLQSRIRRGNDPWYQRRLDLVYLDWKPGSVIGLGDFGPLEHYLTDLVERDVREGCIRLEVLFPFRKSPGGLGQCMTNELRRAILSLRKRPRYYVILDRVDIHVPKSVARSSGLFGLLGDEPIQLVHPDDEEVFERFLNMLYRFRSVNGVRSFIYRIVSGGSEFRMSVDRAREMMIKLLLYLCAWEEGLTIPSWRQLSLEPPPSEKWRLSREYKQHRQRWVIKRSNDKFGYAPSCAWWTEETRILTPNWDNEWVSRTMKTLPDLQPRIMFRLVETEET